MRTTHHKPLSKQLKERVYSAKQEQEEKEGVFFGNNISTGSTLLDLAISGGRVRGGGIPAGILIEIFGPSGSGKTVLLSEIAGDVQRKGGDLIYHDPEARLDQQFARQFGLHLSEENYLRPNTVPEVFKAVRKWKPEGDGVHGIFADSLAALSTNMEMENDEGDKMGMRRAKEFSEELRKTCRILAQNNYLMVCSNQVRVNADGGQWAPKFTTPGGESVGFYSSVRLKTQVTEKVKKVKSIHGKNVDRIIGVEVKVEVIKNSVWKPYRTAPLTIIFDYGIDDIRQNLQYIKTYSKNNVYTIGNEKLGQSIEDAIAKIEEEKREKELKEEVIQLWNKIESQFDSHRKPKRRTV